MKIEDFVKTYYLHDSLLENVIFDKASNKVTLYVDFCYWLQKDYEEGPQETGRIFIEFSNVSSLNYIPHQINAGEIIKTSYVGNEVTLTVFNDIMNDCFDIVIKSDCVEVFR